jgi:CheY-specific phosphatase CheX
VRGLGPPLYCLVRSADGGKNAGRGAGEAKPEMWDAVGEVCNMIAGNFKNKIPGMGDGCMLSVPTVITGTDYSLHALADSGKIEVHLLFEELPLIVSIEVHS